jgi:hypothetical protein
MTREEKLQAIESAIQTDSVLLKLIRDKIVSTIQSFPEEAIDQLLSKINS